MLERNEEDALLDREKEAARGNAHHTRRLIMRPDLPRDRSDTGSVDIHGAIIKQKPPSSVKRASDLVALVAID